MFVGLALNGQPGRKNKIRGYRVIKKAGWIKIRPAFKIYV